MDIISRAQWHARHPKQTPLTTTWAHRTEFVVHHSEGPVTQTVRSIQDFHMDTRGWNDVAYNFLVDHLGRIYEGRGWLVIGAQAQGHNTSGIGVCVIGRDGADISAAAKASVRALYDEANRRAGRTLTKRGHGQLSGNQTDCPGKTLLAWVKAGMPNPSKPQETAMTKDEIYDAVWENDRMTAPDGNTTTNPTWRPSSVLTDVDIKIRALQAKVDAMTEMLGDIAAAVIPPPDPRPQT